MYKAIHGFGKPVVGIVGCLHGNEVLGKKIIETLKDISLVQGTIVLLLANTEAMKQGKRFIDADLNRCFPGKENGNHEEKLAISLLDELSKCDYVIDLHSTSAETENFIIITKEDEETKKLVHSVPLNKVVLMKNNLIETKTLIDNVGCGISLEFDERIKPEEASLVVMNCLRNLKLVNGKCKSEIPIRYLVYGDMKKSRDNIGLELINFREVEVCGEKFYPILFGEKEYGNILCLKAKICKIKG